MYENLLKLFVYLLCLKINEVLAASRRLIDQRDMSEHCRRRVMPSVFLGQHVMSANSHVMQFSQLELPYSCSLSVRAESGSNIILVVELLSEDILRDACTLSGDQLIVYELGETFGGYWGPIPNTIMNGSPKNYTQYYTLKTTRRPTPSKRTPQSTLEKILKQTDTQSTIKEQEYYTMNVPIVNISGNFQLGPPREANYEELFNYIYDVTPRNGVEYETSIMPLVQFSIREQKGVGEERLYELDYNPKGVTMDPRLIFNTAKKKKTPFKKDWKVNKLFRHGTKSDMFRRRGYKKLFTARTPYINKVTTIIPTLDSKYLKKSWELVDDIVKSINMTTVRSTVFQNETFRNILHDISKLQHNSSVYLAHNISIYNDISAKENEARFKDETDSNQTVDNSTKFDQTKTRELDMFTTLLQSNSEKRSTQVTLDLSEMETELDFRSENDKIDILGNTVLERIQKDVINISTEKITLPNEDLKDITTLPNTFPSTNKSTKTSILTGAMVDHESWENIIQAAPVMAVVLNKTEPLINNTLTDVFNKSKHKRHIQSLEIDQSRPRNLTAKPALVTDAPQIEDIHDLARMIELDDDELSSRVALRYLRHYAGPALYNLCDIREHSLRQIFLFNSSRIVISVSNFTLDRLMLVLTPAQTLNSGVSQCPEGQLECQIVGTRVCIDSLNACDGVPNCGSYEIYDEDRLTCGTSHGVQRSVCLAALSFLAVILTAAYIILYWLEKCVPRVSDAFFVYTDSSENELFLDSIMRSPNDDDDPSYKINLPGHFFDDDALYQDINAKENKVLFLKKIFNACWKFLGLKKIATEKPSQNDIPENQLTPKEPTRMFSFTQLELKKFGRIEFKEKGVQTGDVFEMQESNIQQNKQEQNSLDSWKRLKEFQYRHDNRSDSELNLLKFSKDSKSLSSQCDSTFYENPNTMKRQAVGIGTDGEMEIRNTLYENVVTARKIPVTCEVHTETKRTGESSKRLRFDEELKMISAIEEDNNRSSSYIKRLNNEDSDNITDVPDVASPGRDFMRFWGGKGKKSKKKKLKHLSML